MTPIGLVMQAVLKAIGANSDRDGFFAPALAETILENWQREQAEDQCVRDEDRTPEPNEPGHSAVDQLSKTLPAIQTPEGAREPAQIWESVLKELRGQMTKATFDNWVKSTFVVEARDGENPMLIIGTRKPYAVEWLEHRLHATIQRTVCGIVGRNIAVRFVVV